jgi:hypothetical protein
LYLLAYTVYKINGKINKIYETVKKDIDGIQEKRRKKEKRSKDQGKRKESVKKQEVKRRKKYILGK